jgi:hypothetical protein
MTDDEKRSIEAVNKLVSESVERAAKSIEVVHKLIAESAEHMYDANDAMKYTQAALNAANALLALKGLFAGGA